MNFEDLERDFVKALVNQAVSKQEIEEMSKLFENLKENFNKSTSDPFCEAYLTIFSQVAKSSPNLSLNDFREWKLQFKDTSITCLEKINRSDDTTELHELCTITSTYFVYNRKQYL